MMDLATGDATPPETAEESACDPMGDAFGHDVALQVLARAFAEDVDVTYAEWRAWYKPAVWMWWARGLGAFIGLRIAADRAASVPPEEASGR